MVSTDGTLYAANLKADGGIERCLNPTYPLGPTFEAVTRGLEDGATLFGLWLYDNQLWSIDTQNTRLMTYTDSLTLPITLTSPPDQAPGIGIKNIRLEWETLRGATEYKWQLDYDTDFSTVPTGFEGETKASSARLPELELWTTYYWRVRATEPVLSLWSAKGLFTTRLGTETTIAIISELYSPEPGANGVPLRPVFQWSSIVGADSYELLVSTDDSFANPAITKIGAYALPSTAWRCGISLDYDTTYYWKVRAISSDTQSAWSAVGAFTTESPPALEPSPLPTESPPSSPPPPSPPPPPPVQPATPDWVNWLIHLGGALLLIMVVMLITLIALTVKVFRL